MSRPWQPGPVFVYETILEARRWQVYATRSAFVLLLLGGMGLIWFGAGGARDTMSTQELARISYGFFSILGVVQLSLVLLAAPAVAAGSICGDRARGTLAHMMVTDLADREIVLGKLGSRLTPVLGVVLAAVPVAALGGLMGGLDFSALLALFAETAAMAVFGVSLAMAASVRAERPREVLMLVYAVETAWLLVVPLWWIVSSAGLIGLVKPGASMPGPPSWFQAANPFVIAFAPYDDQAIWTFGYVAGFCGGLLALSAILIGLAMLGLRRAAFGGTVRKAAKVRRRSLAAILFPSVTGPSLDGNPVLWREWHRNRPSRWERRIGWGLAVVCWGMVLMGVYATITQGPSNGMQQLFLIPLLIHCAFGFLMLSVAAPSSLAEERVRGSLDVLLTTPMASRAVLAAKWWGLYRRVLTPAVLVVFTVGFVAATTEYQNPVMMAKKIMRSIPVTDLDRALAVSLAGADFLASGAVIVSLGLALATWVRRLGRAIGAGVTAFFFFGIFWLFLIEILESSLVDNSQLQSNRSIQWTQWLLEASISISPVLGPVMPMTEMTNWHTTPLGSEWIAMGVIVVLKLAVAWGLFALTARTFDRCMGRVPDRPRRRWVGLGSGQTVRPRKSKRPRLAATRGPITAGEASST